MKWYQAIGYQLLATTAISDIVGTRVYHGKRPEALGSSQTSYLPAIAFEEVAGPLILAGGWVETRSVLIHSYAETDSGAWDLAKEVKDMFHSLYGSINGFDIQRVYVRGSGGLIFDNAVRTFDAPIEIDVYYYEDET